MKLHRLFTERVNLDGILELVSKAFDGFTVYQATGYWKGKPEESTVVETITDDTSKFRQLATDIKTLNKQETVLIEVVANSAEFI